MYKKQVTIQEMTQEPLSRVGLCFTYEQLNILNTFQTLFMQLVVLMRGTSNAWIFKNPNFNAFSQNLMSISESFLNALIPFYGPSFANRFSSLMTNFISNIFTTLESVTTNNQELLNQAAQKWYSDADELAKFLDSINIFWTQPQWQNLLYQFIQLNLSIVGSLYTGEYDREQQVYNQAVDIGVIMGNFMAQGLIARDLLKEVTPRLTATTTTQRT